MPPTFLPGDTRSRWLLYGGLVAVVIVFFAGAALLYPRLTDTKPAANGSTLQPSTGSSAPPATGSTSAGPSADPLAPTASTDPTSAPTSRRAGGGSGPTTPSGPRIVYFRIKQQVKCPRGNDPGQPLILEWHATGGVTKMALSVDNPGLVGGYATYDGPDGSQTFTNFGCAPPAGTTETHIYTIYTVGGGAQKSKTLTISATSNSLETAAPTTSPPA